MVLYAFVHIHYTHIHGHAGYNPSPFPDIYEVHRQWELTHLVIITTGVILFGPLLWPLTTLFHDLCDQKCPVPCHLLAVSCQPSHFRTSSLDLLEYGSH
jgi:hypothetical protein